MCLLFGQTVKTKGLEVLSWKRFVIKLCTNVTYDVQTILLQRMKFKSGILFEIITNVKSLDNSLRPLFFSGDLGLNCEVRPNAIHVNLIMANLQILQICTLQFS